MEALTYGLADIPDTDQRTDGKSVRRVADVLQTSKLTSWPFRVELFENQHRLDLHAYRDDIEDVLNERTVFEVKDSSWAIGQTHEKFVGRTKCQGAFMPRHKIEALAAAHMARFHHQFFAYMFIDDPEIYFIPLDIIWDNWEEHQHPLEEELLLQNKRHVLDREGRRSLPVEVVRDWRGVQPMLDYMDKINRKYFI